MSWDPSDTGDILRDYDSGGYSDDEICNAYQMQLDDLRDIIHGRDTKGGGFLADFSLNFFKKFF